MFLNWSNTLLQKLLFHVIERDAVTLRYHINKEHVENVIIVNILNSKWLELYRIDSMWSARTKERIVPQKTSFGLRSLINKYQRICNIFTQKHDLQHHLLEHSEIFRSFNLTKHLCVNTILSRYLYHYRGRQCHKCGNVTLHSLNTVSWFFEHIDNMIDATLGNP